MSPYKDKSKQREYDKERMRKTRQGRTEGVEQKEDVLPEVELYQGKPRFLTLSDGQVLDRANQPSPKEMPDWFKKSMAAANRADRADLSMSKQERLARLLTSLDKNVTGIDGKANLLEFVRYGVSGLTLSEIKAELS